MGTVGVDAFTAGELGGVAEGGSGEDKGMVGEEGHRKKWDGG